MTTPTTAGKTAPDVSTNHAYNDAFNAFISALDQRKAEYWKEMEFDYKPAPKHTFTQGKRYDKVICESSVVAFVEQSTGDIFKPAGWSAPAKHVRGNIFSDSNGLEAVGSHGEVRYLR